MASLKRISANTRSGAFYRQFGLTMAVSVGISALNAFTLSPALCAMLLIRHKYISFGIIAVVGGMIVGSIALLFLVPALFVIFQWMQED